MPLDVTQRRALQNAMDQTPQRPPPIQSSRTAEVRTRLRDRMKLYLTPTSEEELDAPPDPAAAEATLRTITCLSVFANDGDPTGFDSILSTRGDGTKLVEHERIFRQTWDAEFAAGVGFGQANDLLEEICNRLEALGVVGERDLCKTIYLIATSRLLDEPSHGLILSRTASGKSHVLAKVTSLIPPEGKLVLTAMTPKALIHVPPGSLVHKLLVLGERSRSTTPEAADATKMIRQLKSEGRISYSGAYPTSKGGKPQTITIEQEGPVAVIETTTLEAKKIFDEDLNRDLRLHANESEEQTRRIMLEYAKRCETGGTSREDADRIVAEQHAFQRSLEPLDVIVPFASEVAAKLPAVKTEARRSYKHVIALTKACALLYQHQRQKDSAGRIIATKDDYNDVRRLLAKPLGESLAPDIEKSMWLSNLAAAFRRGQIFTAQEAAALSGWPDPKGAENRKARTRLDTLVKLGFLDRVSVKPGQWRLPINQCVLPELD